MVAGGSASANLRVDTDENTVSMCSMCVLTLFIVEKWRRAGKEEKQNVDEPVSPIPNRTRSSRTELRIVALLSSIIILGRLLSFV